MREPTNAERTMRLLDGGVFTRYDAGLRTCDHTARRRVLHPFATTAEDTRAAVAEAYDFLIEQWRPGDRIFLFGVGLGGYAAQTLAGLLGTVGFQLGLKDYALTAYATPHTHRTPADWARVRRLFAELSGLSGGDEIAVPVAYLGLWDALRMPGAHTAPLDNVKAGRHAVAIDGPPGQSLVTSERVEEVWFRGGHRDIAGGLGAAAPLADIALDWVLDGAVAAGLPVSGWRAPLVSDALADSTRTLSVRRLPERARVHASVGVYLRERPQYWRRLPGVVVWADADWAARAERLAPVAPQRVHTPALANAS